MRRIPVCFLAICFPTMCSFAAVGFSQQLHQASATDGAYFTYGAHSVQHLPDQHPTPSSVSSQIPEKSSPGVTINFADFPNYSSDAPIRTQDAHSGTPGAQISSATEQIRSPGVPFGSPNVPFGSPNNQFGSPNNQFGSPNNQFGSSQERNSFQAALAKSFCGLQGQVVIGPNGVPNIINPNYGYNGPGDMRTHLWNEHSDDLRRNGISKGQLDMMPMAAVQQWHNIFHGTEERPHQ